MCTRVDYYSHVDLLLVALMNNATSNDTSICDMLAIHYKYTTYYNTVEYLLMDIPKLHLNSFHAHGT